MVREIFQRKQGKDFYRDELEYLEYDPIDFADHNEYYDWAPPDDEEIAYKIAKKLSKKV